MILLCEVTVGYISTCQYYDHIHASHRCQHQRTKKRDRADEKAKKAGVSMGATENIAYRSVRSIHGFCPSYDNLG